MMPSEGEGFLRYTGEILEMNLSEWVLRNSAPGMGELTVATSAGKLIISMRAVANYSISVNVLLMNVQVRCMLLNSFPLGS